MNRNIKKFLTDESGSIYVHTQENILYRYDNEHLTPFLMKMEGVKKCFRIFDQYLVYHNNQITVFNKFLNILGVTQWSINNIDDVCCCSEKNIMVTLEGTNVYIHYNVISHKNDSEDIVTRFFVNGFCSKVLNYDGTKDTQFKKIKIIDSYLLVYDGTKASIFSFGVETVKNHLRLQLSEELFDDIIRIDNGTIHLQNGLAFLQNGKIKSVSVEEDTLFENRIFLMHKIYFTLKNKNLVCFYDSKYAPIMDSLLHTVQFTNLIKTDFSADYNVISFDYSNDITVLEQFNAQILLIDNQLYQIVDDCFVKFKFDVDKIIYDNVNDDFDLKLKFAIDLKVNEPVMEQLIKIIPAIYRLNTKVALHFEQVEADGTIRSYGTGVTRQIFSVLKDQLNELLSQHLTNSAHDLFDIGKLIYFCTKEGLEKLDIHPIFFYYLSKQSDHLYLLKHFKGNDYPTYKKQYLHYTTHIEELNDLELDSIDDYVKYLLASNLNSSSVEAYEKIAAGYTYFAIRTKKYSLIKALPIAYLIREVSQSIRLPIRLIFVKHPEIETRLYTTFKNNFKKCLGKLNNANEKTLVQNITGSKYYTGHLTIGLFPIPKENNPAYKISTCEATLSFYIHPTLKNMAQIMDMLILPDLSLKD